MLLSWFSTWLTPWMLRSHLSFTELNSVTAVGSDGDAQYLEHWWPYLPTLAVPPGYLLPVTRLVASASHLVPLST